MSEEEFWLGVNVQGKKIMISVGEACQRVKWLAYVGIAKWDEETHQGWKRLGVPTAIRAKSKTGPLLDFGSIIRDVLQNGDEIFVNTSLNPEETK